MPHDDPLYTDAALVTFYDAENEGGADVDFCTALARGGGSVLDLGCGTGSFLAGLDVPRRVGVDPAAAMLDIARARPGGADVEWIEADARRLDLGRRFDLVVMTGHAFQVFLGEDDQRAALATIARHLAPGGRFIFDSRNPACREWEEWQPHNSRRRVSHPRHGEVEAWNSAVHDAATGIVTYETFYRLADGRELTAASRIRFTPRDELARLIADAGLTVERWLGDWSGGPLDDRAPEIIPLGRLG
ncbi:class I SAM-dependent methyltransferase [Ancylobacter defluvii]|uniref:Methyltransferase n=1 Tax=Ancylobacter defluvii TaxID=1282440 RepID=A0A9W6K1R4_9HYPH|nr:class I SAM-dependent methyltransferase [Ancylobacter defluvii]MBS7588005.1 class I SAM-dependent methyltransferase [Ancylobacter defluvii]GLK86399.1 methyltransferase [Ancylobacter defluvii]